MSDGEQLIQHESDMRQSREDARLLVVLAETLPGKVGDNPMKDALARGAVALIASTHQWTKQQFLDFVQETVRTMEQRFGSMLDQMEHQYWRVSRDEAE